MKARQTSIVLQLFIADRALRNINDDLLDVGRQIFCSHFVILSVDQRLKEEDKQTLSL